MNQFFQLASIDRRVLVDFCNILTAELKPTEESEMCSNLTLVKIFEGSSRIFEDLHEDLCEDLDQDL